MNILIVDDNKNNRMILRLLLEDYMDENEGVTFSLDEAEDGQVAVDKCKNGNFDLVLMDIMMPNMDGIEATKIIRKTHEKIMIIAVSAVDDSERKKLILDSGAEDYIAKPVNANIFVSRIQNYITLIESRAHKKISYGYINLFTKEIYNRHTAFMFNNEDSLAEFWEFFLLNAREKSDLLSDVVRAIFSIAEKQLSISKETILYIEESEDRQYFTLTNISILPQKVIELLLIKNAIKDSYLLSNEKLSFSLVKVQRKEFVEEAPIPDIKEENIVVAPEVVEEIASKIELTASLSLSVFDYMEEEDLYDLEEYASKLNSMMLLVGGGGVTEDEVIEISNFLEKLGSILSTYSEVYVISKALAELSIDMSSHMQEFIDNSEALGPMCKAFSNDMSNWIEQTFHTGAPSVDFMNDTIVVNCQTIGGMLKMDEAAPAGDDDFDDIFDF